ncbi:DUF4352 domain-containing protein [Haladaptatus sp. CMAA 1911]|uniref:DUF4352 domain-containing protein n=1 Tax=unclassified Haladaptatus TaxID=2622732 RepID=UPI0037553C83
MNRRTIIRKTGVVTAGLSLSGCLGNSSSGSNEENAGVESTNTKTTESKSSTTNKVRTLQMGATAKLRNGVQFAVTGVELKNQIVRQGTSVEPAPKKQFAIVSIESRNKGDEKQQLPRAITMTLKANGKRYSATSYTGSEYTQYRYRGGESDPGAIRDGELRFEIPESVSKSGLTVLWTYEGLKHPITIRWQT